MIIARSPLRITLGGGGTDLPSYYRENEGFLIAAAIDKYIYITIHKTFVDELLVKYSKLERVDSACQLEHPIIRETFELMGMRGNSLEITSMADIPAGTGLGSSGSFTTALVRAMYQLQKLPITAGRLAEMACEIEIDRLKEPIGKQDQYIAAYGGVTAFQFNKDDSVSVHPVHCSEKMIHDLEDSLLLFFTGYSRRASSILSDQDRRSREDDTEIIRNLDFVKDIGLKSLAAIEAGNLREFGLLMHAHWEHKKRRSSAMSNDRVDEWYQIGMQNGALGGKLVGAGGGGFLMFCTEDRMRLRDAMAKLGLKEVRFRFDYEGAKILVG
jgi:D-glycero-alpha-D-manno-heptose-7-phosphate kinase